MPVLLVGVLDTEDGEVVLRMPSAQTLWTTVDFDADRRCRLADRLEDDFVDLVATANDFT